LEVDRMSDLKAAYLADLRLRKMAASTIESCGYRIDAYLRWCEGKALDPCLAGRENLLSYLEYRGEQKSASLKKDFSALATFYELLEEQGKSSSASHVRSIQKKYLRSYKSDAEQRQIISIRQMAEMVAATVSTRDQTILLLLAKTGIRRGELLSLDISDVDLGRMTIRLKPTGKRSNRMVFFDYETQEVLQRWLKIREGLKGREPALFVSVRGIRPSKETIRWVVARAAERVGLHTPGAPLEQRFGPHCCRHWFTTHLLRAGMRREYVQWLRGDAIKEAVDIYYHIDPEDVRKSYLAYIPKLGV
jgi:integrase/recombinase XerD